MLDTMFYILLSTFVAELHFPKTW